MVFDKGGENSQANKKEKRKRERNVRTDVG